MHNPRFTPYDPSTHLTKNLGKSVSQSKYAKVGVFVSDNAIRKMRSESDPEKKIRYPKFLIELDIQKLKEIQRKKN